MSVIVEDAKRLSCSICDQVGKVAICTVCARRKKPAGRDSADNGLCWPECPGWSLPPDPGELWPGERYGDSLGHMDWHEAVEVSKEEA